jgi:hypothetical protein
MPRWSARFAPLLLVPVLLLAACSGDSSPPSALPASPLPQPSGPVTAVVSSCSKPFNQGQTTLVVSFRLRSDEVPLHFENAFRGTAYMGASPAPLSGGTASPEPGTGKDVLKMTGPLFDHITFEHAKLVADGQQTVHAPSLADLARKRFRGPFGEARIIQVQTKGSHVVVRVSSPQKPARGVQNLGPQAATLQVGSQTLTPGNSPSAAKVSQYVNALGFTGTPPMKGPATLTLSSWTLLDLQPLTVVVPATCQAG